jgi:ribosomal protein L14E/L6E/L27E
LVVGIAKAPLKVTKSMSKKRIHRRCRVKPFVKLINYNHVMPTRYSFDMDVKSLVTNEVANDPAKRKEACALLAKKLEEKYILFYLFFIFIYCIIY